MQRISALIRPSLVLGVALTLVGCGTAPQQAVAPVDQSTGGFHILTGPTPEPCPTPTPAPVSDLLNFGNIKAVNSNVGTWGDVTNFGNIDLVNSRGGGVTGDVLNFGNIAAVNGGGNGTGGGDVTNFGNIDLVNWR